MNAMSSIEDADEFDEEDTSDFAQLRKKIRERLLVEKILGEGEELIFTGTFDGYGDSGQYNEDAEDEEVNKLFSKAIDKFVHFDWYNNEGGGGDLTWHVLEDRLVINGYYNEIVRQTEMDEAVF